MSQEPIVETLTRASNPLFTEVAEVAQDLGGGGGFSDLLTMLQQGEAAFARFVPLLERVEKVITRLKGVEAGAVSGEGSNDFPALGRADTNRVELIRPIITPAHLYQKLLGGLMALPGDMTVAQALVDARTNKGMLLKIIERELNQLQSEAETNETESS